MNSKPFSPNDVTFNDRLTHRSNVERSTLRQHLRKIQDEAEAALAEAMSENKETQEETQRRILCQALNHEKIRLESDSVSRLRIICSHVKQALDMLG